MGRARRDGNFVPTLIGVSSTDGDTPVEIYADAVTNELFVKLSTSSIVSLTGINGGDVSVGTSEVEMTFTGTTKSIMIQSKVANTGFVWIGLTGVSNSGGSAFAQLSPGQSVTIDLDDSSSAIYAISDTASQTIYKVALT